MLGLQAHERVGGWLTIHALSEQHIANDLLANFGIGDSFYLAEIHFSITGPLSLSLR